MSEIDGLILPLHLDARDLRLVVAVAELGGLSRAGAQLHLAQSTLSHHLADLEGRVGKKLFRRMGRRLALTPLGERFRAEAAPLLASLRSLEDGLRSEGVARPTEVRIATECYTTYPWLARVVRSYNTRSPDRRLNVVAEATADTVEALASGRLDLAIATSWPRERRFHAERLFRDELLAVVAPDHPWATRSRVPPESFRDVHLLTYARDPRQSSFVRETLLPVGVLPREMSGVPLTEGLAELAKAGVGVAILARWAAEPWLRSGELHALRVGASGVQRTWHAVRLSTHADARRLDELSDLIRREGPVPATRGSAALRPATRRTGARPRPRR